MTHVVPNPNKMAKRTLLLLGNEGGMSVSSVESRLKGHFAGYSPNAIKTTLLRLASENVLRINEENYVTLTMNGQARFKQLVLEREERIQEKLLTQEKAKALLVHNRVAGQVAELGQLLGKAVKKEHALVRQGPVILDVVWYEDHNNSCELSQAFEIQHCGNLKNAIYNLEATQRHHPSCRLYLVINDEKELAYAQKLLGITLHRSIRLVSTAEIGTWHRTLSESTKKIPIPLWSNLKCILRNLY